MRHWHCFGQTQNKFDLGLVLLPIAKSKKNENIKF